MSISNTTRKAGPYTGNGSTTGFPFSFKVFSTSDVVVVRADSTSNETTLALGADYLVSLNADQDSNPGGTVNLFSAPLSGYSITLTSNVKNLQPVTLTNQGAFYPKVINDALDRATIQIQQLSEQVGRAFKVPISSSGGAGNTVADYVNQAQASATASAASAVTSGNSASQSAGFAANSAVSAAASAASAASAAASAQTAVTPTAAALAAYLDAFFPASQLLTFSAMRIPGTWDLGTLALASPFTNETTMRRASMSSGAGVFDFGTVP